MVENDILNVLKEHGQEHIVAAYDKLDDAGKEKLAAQVERNGIRCLVDGYKGTGSLNNYDYIY